MNVTCAVADPIPLAPVASFQVIRVGKAIDLYFFCFDIRTPSIICTKPLGLGLRALYEAIIILLPLPDGSLGYVRGCGVLSNMTSALNDAFEFPAHATGRLYLNIFPAFCEEIFSCTIEQVCGLFQPLLYTYIALGFFLSLVPTIFLKSFSR